MKYAYGLIGLVVGSGGMYLYATGLAKKKYEEAAAAVGMTFKKVEGKFTAILKGL